MVKLRRYLAKSGGGRAYFQFHCNSSITCSRRCTFSKTQPLITLSVLAAAVEAAAKVESAPQGAPRAPVFPRRKYGRAKKRARIPPVLTHEMRPSRCFEIQIARFAEWR
ncbi:hypothetical protein Zmor_022516 [Zophobas morio]|uniref:Uncharacterized protein n=1 Tax=Zophobas morio TaxID=2755281 RepID=A0AA38M6I9_9CUCU|nr:hypothetical protein Zmor_022516 [Zophobas morio]